MDKPKDFIHQKFRNKEKSEAINLLNAEQLILDFLHKGSELFDAVRPTTEISLNEFRKYIQERKDALDEKREK